MPGPAQDAVPSHGGTRLEGVEHALQTGRQPYAEAAVAAEREGGNRDRSEDGGRIGAKEELRRVEQEHRLHARIGEGAEEEGAGREGRDPVSSGRPAAAADAGGIDRPFQEVARLGVEGEELVDEEAQVERAVRQECRVPGGADEVASRMIGADDDEPVARQVREEVDVVEAGRREAVRVHDERERARSPGHVAVGCRADDRPCDVQDVARHTGHRLRSGRVVDFGDQGTGPGTDRVRA